jgi:hypothetical protein
MLPIQELEYSAFRHSLAALEEEFRLQSDKVIDPGDGQKVKLAEA